MISFPDMHVGFGRHLGFSSGFETFAIGMALLTFWLASRITRIQFTNPDAHPDGFRGISSAAHSITSGAN